jgi:quercetin dioxygenase-like cupin family protein
VTFTAFVPPPEGTAGFHVLAGREQGLERLMIVSGRLPAEDVGPVHAHEGDEVLRIVSGLIVIRCGEARRVCESGDLVVVPPGELHGFRAVTETIVEVIAEYDMGTLFPIRADNGGVELVEVYRRELPWGRAPGPERTWTTDEELRGIHARVAYDI